MQKNVRKIIYTPLTSKEKCNKILGKNGIEADYYVIMSFREEMVGVNFYYMLQNLPWSYCMKMRRISALKNLSECFDINEGGTAGFRSLGDWSCVHPLFYYLFPFI